MKKLLTLVLLFGLIINLDVIACRETGASCSAGWGAGADSFCCSNHCYLAYPSFAYLCY
jgi:hypothetical protein